MSENLKFYAVVIGRNEGERLKLCLTSLADATVVVYVDSGSTDGSAQWALEQKAEVVLLDMSMPFTAARARNAGFRRLQEIAPGVSFVQFVDGDCEVSAGWSDIAVSFLMSRTNVAVVTGRLRERYPSRSVYNWLCEREWELPVGAARACGGIAMIRATALRAAGGYREDLIAGEEPELCVRLRATGWTIWRLDTEMAIHDAAMMHFSQWWRRAARGGYAFAHGAYLHGAPPEWHWVWESSRAWLWAILLPLACLASGILFGPWGWVTWIIYPLQLLRQVARNEGGLAERVALGFFQLLARFAEGWGQIRFLRDRLFGRQVTLIEYK
jgi:GT2 family glycosyltransferase